MERATFTETPGTTDGMPSMLVRGEYGGRSYEVKIVAGQHTPEAVFAGAVKRARMAVAKSLAAMAVTGNDDAREALAAIQERGCFQEFTALSRKLMEETANGQ